MLSGVIDLDRSSSVSLYSQLYGQLRAAILSARLPPGMRIPASRTMATQLGVARNTVLAAVDQLVAEGYLDTRQGAGTVVSGELSSSLVKATHRGVHAPPRSHKLSRAGRALASVRREAPAGETPRPFMPGVPDLEAFPADVWGRLLRRASQRLELEAKAYGSMPGAPRLRAVISAHLRETRGVDAEPSQIIVTSTAQGALDLLARALLDPGDAVWVEDPGYFGARAAFLGAGANLVPVPVDGQGLNPDGAQPPPRIIYVTPSHQYPTGCQMPLARRLELIDCAAQHGTYIVEDDYDSEFQFQGRPVASLQGLDPGEHVIYAGTFSKILQPGIRVGYVVAPRPLVEPLIRIQRNTGQVVSAVVQEALAQFIEEGHLRAHVRRMRTLYQERQEALANAFHARLSGVFTVKRPAGGMQLIAEISADQDDVALAHALAKEGIVARPVSQFYLGNAVRRGLLLGFAAFERSSIEKAVADITRTLEI